MENNQFSMEFFHTDTDILLNNFEIINKPYVIDLTNI